jgi:tRNA-specific 2-thiouridylase
MRIAILLSGGVDSSVALRLLREQGYTDLTAFYLKIWLEDDFQFLGSCPWEEDLRYARSVCEDLGVPLEVVSLQTAYWDRVVAQTIAELQQGHTPSPDILCNQRVKFGAFLDLIGDSFDKVVSGHYAQVVHDQGLYWLHKGRDPVKDQTYFLSQLSQQQLARCWFPIGPYQKAGVRALAEKFDLATQQRKDSQGICFLGKIKYRDFVKAHLGERPGVIVERETGRELGPHKGFWFHTIGQRRGLGLSGGPWFVVDKDPTTNVVYVSTEQAHTSQSQLSFGVDHINWISGAPDLTAGPFAVKVRHGQHTTPCRLSPGTDAQRLNVHLESPDGGIAPGQYAVFYQGDVCLGSGTIRGSLVPSPNL